MPPDPTLDVTQSAAARASGTSSRAQAGGEMSQDARHLQNLQDHTTQAMGRMYQRPEEAYRRLTELDAEGVERFRENQNEIGPLREGVHLSQNEVGGLIASRQVSNMTPDAAHTEVDTRRRANTQSPDASKEIKSPAQSMNESLSSTPSTIHALTL